MNETQAAMPNLQALPLEQTEDPFSFGSASEVPASLPQESLPLDEHPQQQKAMYAGIGVLILAIFFGFYQIFVNDFNPLDGFLDFFGSSPDEVKPQPKVATHKPKAVSKPPVEVDPIESPVSGNPYWILPNYNPTLAPSPSSSVLTLEQEAGLREGASHTFVYQHFKAVQDVRRSRWAGTEAILKQSMSAKKFWTRMFAAVGLAEMAFSVLLVDLDKAIEGERSELVAAFFERFVDKPNAGQAYILRQVIRLVDSRARMVIIDGIAKAKDDLSYLYLFAAAQDPNPKVQGKALRYLKKYSPSVQMQSLADQMVQGKLAPKAYLKALNFGGNVRFASDEGSVTRTFNAQEKILTEGDIEQQMTDFLSDPGDIEFLETDTKVFEAADSPQSSSGNSVPSTEENSN